MVPLLTGLLPIVAVHLTYWVSADQGYVPWCFIYTESCSSISATGRHGSAYFIFKGMMIPAAMIMILYWILSYQWLIALGDKHRLADRSMLILGVIAAVFLILYVIALGAGSDYFRLQRKVGVTIYFTFTYLAQLLLTYRSGILIAVDKSRTIQLFLNYSVLAIGISTLFLDLLLDKYEDYEDAFEWNMALLIHLYFLVNWYSWRFTNFRLRFDVKGFDVKSFDADTKRGH